MRASDPPVAGLGLVIGVAVHAALAALLPGTGFLIKWPNDILVGPAKIAGMLLERDGDAVIAGIGVNVAHAPSLPDRATIALAELPGGQGLDAAAVQERLVLMLDQWLAVWRTEGTGGIIAAWSERAHPIGTPLVVSTGTDAPQQGRFLGLDAHGALILGRDDGTSLVVHSGDVGLVG